jgi:Xaa-Pro aminopeptidase
MEQQLTKILTGLQQIYVMDPSPGVYPPSFLKATTSFHSKFFAGNFFVEQLRAVKSENELNCMRYAGEIAVGGFLAMMERARPYMTELALAAEFEAHCKRQGALWPSFPCVVGTGANAAVIHYLSKRNVLQPNDLVLVDSGCEVPGYYVSDITRTWPVTSSASLSTAQTDLYEFTLDVQKQSLQHLETQLTTGQSISLDQLHAFASRLMTDGLRQFGFLGPKSTMRDLHRYNPTHIGHYLGMDVHDTPNVSRSVPLRPGMVVTVEPGVYLPQNDQNLPKEFRGIGIRIEDDVIVSVLCLCEV